MVASRERLQELASERRLQPATLERVIRLLDILDAFSADSLIAPRVALKGGTALNLFHFNLDRLSVDIDLNYIGELEKERMDEDRPGLEDRIERLMGSKGYAARRVPSEHAGGKWIYRYGSALGGAGSIEIDINYLYRGPIYGVDRLPSLTIGPYQAAQVPVLDIHEIVAGKVVALVTRRTARDLFDAHRILRMPKLDWSRVKLITLMIGASAGRFDWRTAAPELIECDASDITKKLITCLPHGYLDTFGGPGAWIETVRADCSAALAPLFQFTDGEKAFLDRILDEGIIDPSGLDAAEQVRRAIAACPALRWKAQNVRVWKAKRNRREQGQQKT